VGADVLRHCLLERFSGHELVDERPWRGARAQAIARQHPFFVSIDLQRRWALVSGPARRQLPAESVVYPQSGRAK
jgi:hypothetical protein